MSKKHMRKLLWGIVIVLALLIVYFLVENRAGYEISDLEQPVLPSPTMGSKSPGTTISGLTVVNVTPNISYTAATQKYANRMQINATCNLSTAPNIVVKSGSTVMFDNRSATTKTIALNSYKFSIKGYGWIALTLKTSKPPLSISIDCDKGQNNGTILLER